MLCSLCQNVSKEIHQLLLRTSFEGLSYIPDPTNLKLHASSFTALQASAKLGCDLCKLLVQSVLDQVGESQVSALGPEHASLSYYVDRYDTGGRQWIESVIFYFGYSKNPLQINLYRCCFRVELIRLSVCHRSRYIDITGRHIHSDPSSDQNILLIRDWIRECDTLHPDCRQAVPTKLPTRVIDVGVPDGSSEPCLLVTEGKIDQYATLTHVWGGLVPVRTTRNNLDDFLSALPLSLLPPSFRDAIRITRKLGLRYLWVDALCIIQDSTVDWEKECARMGDIYKNSSITIAAVDAENSQIGFLNKRPSSISNPPSCKLPCLMSEGCTDTHIEMAQREPKTLLDGRSPLTFRAWCFQENLMSLRTLYFGNRQTYWDCNTLAHLEAYGTAPPQEGVLSGLHFGKVGYRQVLHFNSATQSVSTEPHPTLGIEGVKQIYAKRDYDRDEKNEAEVIQSVPGEKTGKEFDLWNSVILEYSSHALTDLKDKLPALSGLAHEMQKITGYTYLAGIWMEGLHEFLYWTVKNPEEEQSQAQSDEYIAPSWSWASYNGAVYRSPIYSHRDMKVLEAVTIPAGLDPCGKVTGGHLRIHGRLRPAVVPHGRREKEDHAVYWTYNRPLEDLETKQEIGKCTIDNINFDSLNPAGKQVFCLAIQREVSNNICRSTIMILEEADRPSRKDTFRRIGIGALQNAGPSDGTTCQEWFADCDPQEVIIV